MAQDEPPVSVQSGGDSTETLLKRGTRRAVQDVLSTPAALIGTLPAAADALIDWKLKGSVDTFGEGMMNDRGRDLMRIVNDENAPPEVRNAAATNLNARGIDNLRPGARLGYDAYRWAGEVAGTQDRPDGSVPMDEEIAGVGITSALTLPVAPLRLGGLVGKVANNAAMRGLARAAEFATPITVVRAGASGAEVGAAQLLNATVGVGVDQAARHLMDEPTLFTQGTQEIDDEGLPGYSEPETTGAGIAGTAGAIGAGGLAGIGLAAALRPSKAAAMIDSLRASQGNPGSLGPRHGSVDRLRPSGAGEGVEQVTGALTDDKAIIKQTLQAVGRTDAQEIDDTVRTLTGAPISETIRRTYEHGDLGQNVRVTPLAAWRQGFNRLDPTAQASFDMGYEAAAELGRRARGIRSLVDLTDQTLHTRVQVARRNPEVAKLMDDYANTMRGFSELRYKSGIIDRAQYLREQRSGPYMRYVEKDVDSNAADSVTKRIAEGRLFGGRDIGTAAEEMQARKGGMKNLVRASDVLDDYTTRQLRNINNNEARRMVLQALAGRPQQTSKTTIVQRATRDVDTPNTVTVFDNGQKKVYSVGDKRLMTALQFRPRATVPGATALRRWFQIGTTGNLNPMFAPISALNDIGAGFLGGRTSNMVSGYFDQALKEAFDGAGMPTNLSNGLRSLLAGPVRVAELPLSLVEGMMRGARGRWLQVAASRAQKLANDSGTPMNKQLAADALKQYYDSRYARMHTRGYAPNAFVVDYENSTNALQRLVNQSNHGIVRTGYVHALETVREAYRMAAFSRNYAHATRKKGSPLNAKEERRVAAEVRELGADITKQSQSQGVNAVLSTIPYGNTILQSTAHLVHSVLTNPAAWSVMGSIGAFRAYSSMTMSQEARDYIQTEMPPYQLTDTWFIENRPEGEDFDPQEHLTPIHLGPELGMITSLTSMFMEAMGVEGGIMQPYTKPAGSPEGNERVGYLLAELIGFGVPTAVDVGAALAGKGPVDIRAGLDDRSIFRQPRDGDFRGEGLSDGHMTDYIANILDAALGTAGRMIVESSEALLDHPLGTMSKEAWHDAMDVTMHESFERQRVGQWLTDATKQLPRSTPQGSAAYELDRTLDEAATFARDIWPTANTPDDADLLAGRAFQVIGERLQTPELIEQAGLLHSFLLDDRHQEDMRAIGQLKKRMHGIRGNVDAPVESKNQVLNAINEEVQDRFARVLHNYDRFETTMVERYGDGWTLDKFMRAAKQDVR